MQSHVLYKSCFIIFGLWSIISCDSKSPLEEPLSNNNETTAIQNGEIFEATKLRDAVGQMNHFAYNDQELIETNVAEEAVPFIGRYKTKIDCVDEIIQCDEGMANVILNLLPDGTAHSSIIHLGQITYNPNLQYEQDIWYFDAEKQEIVLERNGGVTFFFKADQPNQLILDAEKVKIATEINREFFASGNPEPAHDYVFNKE